MSFSSEETSVVTLLRSFVSVVLYIPRSAVRYHRYSSTQKGEIKYNPLSFPFRLVSTDRQIHSSICGASSEMVNIMNDEPSE